MVLHVVHQLGGDDVRVGRAARDVARRASPEPVLDERDPRAELTGSSAGAVAGSGAGTEDEQVIAVGAHVSPVLVRRDGVTVAGWSRSSRRRTSGWWKDCGRGTKRPSSR